MKRVSNLDVAAAIVAGCMLALSAPAAEAVEVCTRTGSADVTPNTQFSVSCKQRNSEADLESRVIDTRSQFDTFTYDLVPKVEEQDAWPFPGRRVQAWVGGMKPTTQDLARIRRLQERQPQ